MTVFLLLLGGTALFGFRPVRTLAAGHFIDQPQVSYHLFSEAEYYREVLIRSNGETVVGTVIILNYRDDKGNGYALYRFFPVDHAFGGAVVLHRIEKGGRKSSFTTRMEDQPVNHIGESQFSQNIGPSAWKYEDLLDETIKDYSYRRQLDVDLDGVECNYLIAQPESKRARSFSGYKERHFWIAREDGRLMRLDFFDRDGELQKSLEVTLYKNQPTVTKDKVIKRPKRLQLTDYGTGDVYIYVLLGEFQKVKMPFDLFNTTAIQKWSEKEDQRMWALINSKGN